MCGRIALFSPPPRLARFLDAALVADLDVAPRWNVAPQSQLLGVSEHDGARVLESYRWGLVPHWSKEPTTGTRLFNARSETLAEKPSFRQAFAKRPCVLPVDGFYEWDRRDGRSRQAHYFTRTDGEPLLLAGLYEHWRRDPSAPPLATCTVITTTPSTDVDEIHDRMPVVLALRDVQTWLSVEDEPSDRLLLLRPAPAGSLTHYVVDTRVGSVMNDGPELIRPAPPSSLF